MNGQYILDENGEPKLVEDLIEWASWFETGANRVIKKDRVSNDVEVSTVFLGLDHSFGSGKPVLWETMIFGGPHDQYQDRYTSREEALAGHEKALALATGGQPWIV